MNKMHSRIQAVRRPVRFLYRQNSIRIFLGAWGVHQFYLGDTKKGIIRIVVSLVTCGIGGIWGFIEGIMILCGKITTDAQGNPLAE